jgi:hypothetical protein
VPQFAAAIGQVPTCENTVSPQRLICISQLRISIALNTRSQSVYYQSSQHNKIS